MTNAELVAKKLNIPLLLAILLCETELIKRLLMSRKICIILPTRLNSVRLPNKPLQQLNKHNTLLTNALKTLSFLGHHSYDIKTSFPECQPILIEIGRQFGFENVNQNPTGNWHEMNESWRDLDYDWLVVLNLVCHPFVQLYTIEQILILAELVTVPSIHCKKERTWWWSEEDDGQLERGDRGAGSLDTKTAPILITPTHIADIYRPSDCGRRDSLLNEPVPFFTNGLLPIELVDIDTPEQLQFARKLANHH